MPVFYALRVTLTATPTLALAPTEERSCSWGKPRHSPQRGRQSPRRGKLASETLPHEEIGNPANVKLAPLQETGMGLYLFNYQLLPKRIRIVLVKTLTNQN
jgi:hypothetical protein